MGRNEMEAEEVCRGKGKRTDRGMTVGKEEMKEKKCTGRGTKRAVVVGREKVRE